MGETPPGTPVSVEIETSTRLKNGSKVVRNRESVILSANHPLPPMFAALDPPLGSEKTRNRVEKAGKWTAKTIEALAQEEFERLSNDLAGVFLAPSPTDYNERGQLAKELRPQAILEAVMRFLRRTMPFDPTHPDHETYVDAVSANAVANGWELETDLTHVRRNLEFWALDCVRAFEGDLLAGLVAERLDLALARRAVEARGLGFAGLERNPGFISERVYSSKEDCPAPLDEGTIVRVVKSPEDGREYWFVRQEHWTIPKELRKLWKWPTLSLPNRDNPSEMLEVQLPLVDMSRGPTAVRFPDRLGRFLFKAAGIPGPNRRGPVQSVDQIARLVELERVGDDDQKRYDDLVRSQDEDLKRSRSLLRDRPDFVLGKMGWKTTE